MGVPLSGYVQYKTKSGTSDFNPYQRTTCAGLLSASTTSTFTLNIHSSMSSDYDYSDEDADYYDDDEDLMDTQEGQSFAVLCSK